MAPAIKLVSQFDDALSDSTIAIVLSVIATMVSVGALVTSAILCACCSKKAAKRENASQTQQSKSESNSGKSAEWVEPPGERSEPSLISPNSAAATAESFQVKMPESHGPTLTPEQMMDQARPLHLTSIQEYPTTVGTGGDGYGHLRRNSQPDMQSLKLIGGDDRSKAPASSNVNQTPNKMSTTGTSTAHRPRRADSDEDDSIIGGMPPPSVPRALNNVGPGGGTSSTPGQVGMTVIGSKTNTKSGLAPSIGGSSTSGVQTTKNDNRKAPTPSSSSPLASVTTGIGATGGGHSRSLSIASSFRRSVDVRAHPSMDNTRSVGVTSTEDFNDESSDKTANLSHDPWMIKRKEKRQGIKT